MLLSGRRAARLFSSGDHGRQKSARLSIANPNPVSLARDMRTKQVQIKGSLGKFLLSCRTANAAGQAERSVVRQFEFLISDAEQPTSAVSAKSIIAPKQS